MARARKVDVATVRLWDADVGAVAWNDARALGEFEYEPSFVRQNLNLAPLTMPPRAGVFSFPALNRASFHGLPGLLADALPDRFGNRIIEAWLARQGRTASDFTPVERLCYMGIRGMGALEFKPAIGPKAEKAIPIVAGDEVNHWTCTFDSPGLQPGNYDLSIGGMKSNTSDMRSAEFPVVRAPGPSEPSGPPMTMPSAAPQLPQGLDTLLIIGIIFVLILILYTVLKR